LVNPGHSNKPTQTMMQLFKLIIASERPDLINAQTYELRDATTSNKPEALRLSPRERDLIQSLKQLPPEDQRRVYSVIEALLHPISRKAAKSRS
jgi:hypothetical protein